MIPLSGTRRAKNQHASHAIHWPLTVATSGTENRPPISFPASPSGGAGSLPTSGRCGEFADKYLHKGTKIAVQGRIQTGHYVNKDNVTVYTTDVVVEAQEFAESKAASLDAQAAREQETPKQQPDADGFMQMPDSIDEELPFT